MTDAMKVKEALLPCPFCGTNPTLVIGCNNFEDAEVQCACGVRGPVFDNDARIGAVDKPKSAAVSHWNARAPFPAALDPVTVEACAKVAENVDDVLRGGCDSPDQEWLWTNGGREMQSDIAQAIRALICQPRNKQG